MAIITKAQPNQAAKMVPASTEVSDDVSAVIDAIAAQEDRSRASVIRRMVYSSPELAKHIPKKLRTA